MKFVLLAALLITLAGCPKPELRCDFNNNNVIDASDLGLQQISIGKLRRLYDVTGDGMVLGEDIVICQEEFDEQ